LQRVVVNDVRVQELRRQDGRFGYTIVGPDGSVHEAADGFLRTLKAGTARTYAYLIVDHLRWLAHEGLCPQTASFRDVCRYMGAVGAEYAGPFGSPWREGKKPYRQSTLDTAAAALKGFFLFQASSLGINQGLGKAVDGSRLPTKADRQRAFLGHVLKEMPANPLRPKRKVRRHPKMTPEGARQALLEEFDTARDRMVVTWLGDGGFRIGELTSLHLVDLHLRENAACGECRTAHVHICHREGNANRSRVKTKHDWFIEDGVVRGGSIRRASPAMVRTYFEYMTSEYPKDSVHGMLLVNLTGPTAGLPWTCDSARKLLRRASERLGLGLVRPHQLRHDFGSGVLHASGGNSLIARDAGGWASAKTVEEIYGHTDVDDPVLARALSTVWGETP
jgi:integrase